MEKWNENPLSNLLFICSARKNYIKRKAEEVCVCRGEKLGERKVDNKIRKKQGGRGGGGRGGGRSKPMVKWRWKYPEGPCDLLGFHWSYTSIGTKGDKANVELSVQKRCVGWKEETAIIHPISPTRFWVQVPIPQVKQNFLPCVVWKCCKHVNTGSVCASDIGYSSDHWKVLLCSHKIPGKPELAEHVISC